MSKMSRLLSMHKSGSATRLVTYGSREEVPDDVRIDHFPATAISPQMSSGENTWSNSVYDVTPSHCLDLDLDLNSDQLISSILDSTKSPRHDLEEIPPVGEDQELNRAMNLRMCQLEEQNTNLRAFLSGLKSSDTSPSKPT